MPPEYLDRPLFGGAIRTETRSDLIDMSELRQVPDNQEVFGYPDSEVSIIVEILERVEPTEFEDAIKFHFDSLAHDNSAVSSQIATISTVANDRQDKTPPATVLHGTQLAPKFNHTEPDEIKVCMALYRVEEKPIDLVVTFNIPLRSVDGEAATKQQNDNAVADFDIFVRLLRIEDFSLFA